MGQEVVERCNYWEEQEDEGEGVEEHLTRIKILILKN